MLVLESHKEGLQRNIYYSHSVMILTEVWLQLGTVFLRLTYFYSIEIGLYYWIALNVIIYNKVTIVHNHSIMINQLTCVLQSLHQLPTFLVHTYQLTNYHQLEKVVCFFVSYVYIIKYAFIIFISSKPINLRELPVIVVNSNGTTYT